MRSAGDVPLVDFSDFVAQVPASLLPSGTFRISTQSLAGGAPFFSSYTKDGVEATLDHAVCDGRVKLAPAQRAVARNWKTAEHVLGLR